MVTGKNTSTSNRNLIKFGYMESQRPARGERRWTLMMLLFILIFIKQTPYRTIIRFRQNGLAGDRPRSTRSTKTNSIGATFYSYHIKAGEILHSKLALLNVEKLFLVSEDLQFLSLSLYNTTGLASRMNVLFWEPDDFPVSFSNRCTSWNA